MNQRWFQPDTRPHSLMTHRGGISSFSLNAISAGQTNVAQASTVWPAANLAIYVPFRIAMPMIITQVFWANGATVNGNVDLGIYNADQTQRMSAGTTAQSGVSTMQFVNTADHLLPAGLYYMALASDSATATFLAGTLASIQRGAMMGMAEQTTAFVLPSPATMATFGRTYLPLFGLGVGTIL